MKTYLEIKVTRADEDLFRVETPKPPWQRIYHLGNNKGVIDLMKTYLELKHLSHIDSAYTYIDR